MRSLSNRTIKQKAIIETKKYMQENYEQLAYEAITGQAPTIMKQTEAVMLLALSKHGYGAKRLKDFHEWFCSIMNMPTEMLGNKAKMDDAVKYMQSKYGIDFDAVGKIDFPTYEEYCDEN